MLNKPVKKMRHGLLYWVLRGGMALVIFFAAWALWSNAAQAEDINIRALCEQDLYQEGCERFLRQKEDAEWRAYQNALRQQTNEIERCRRFYNQGFYPVSCQRLAEQVQRDGTYNYANQNRGGRNQNFNLGNGAGLNFGNKCIGFTSPELSLKFCAD